VNFAVETHRRCEERGGHLVAGGVRCAHCGLDARLVEELIEEDRRRKAPRAIRLGDHIRYRLGVQWVVAPVVWQDTKVRGHEAFRLANGTEWTLRGLADAEATHEDGTPIDLEPYAPLGCWRCGKRSGVLLHDVHAEGTLCVACSEDARLGRDELNEHVPVTGEELARAAGMRDLSPSSAAWRVFDGIASKLDEAHRNLLLTAAQCAVDRADPDEVVKPPHADFRAAIRQGLTAHAAEERRVRVRVALSTLAADLFVAGADAYPYWRTDPEVIAAVEAVADHRIGARVSNGRLGRAYVRAWREDYLGLRTKWMQRAWRARNWRKG
jgi:hypothetical protein